MSNCKFNIGDAIEAKAIHITSEAECARRYGSNSKTKLLNGKVTAIINHPSASGRRSWHVTGRYDLGGGVLKSATLHVRSVQAISSAVGGATRTTAVGGSTSTTTVGGATTTGTTVGGATIAVGATTGVGEGATTTAVGGATTVAVGVTTSAVGGATTIVVAVGASTESVGASTESVGATTTAPVIPVMPPLDTIVSTNHGCNWYSYNNPDDLPLNGPVRPIKWSIRFPNGNTMNQSGDINNDEMGVLDYCFCSMPQEQIDHTLNMSNELLRKNLKREMTRVKLCKLMGILILITRFEFTSRVTLWARQSKSKFIPPPQFGKTTGMSRMRFDELWAHLRWSFQPEERPDDKSHSEHRWMLVDDMVDMFNKHRANNFLWGDAPTIIGEARRRF